MPDHLLMSAHTFDGYCWVAVAPLRSIEGGLTRFFIGEVKSCVCNGHDWLAPFNARMFAPSLPSEYQYWGCR